MTNKKYYKLGYSINRMRIDYTGPVFEDKPVLDVNQGVLRCPSPNYALSDPAVIKALRESVRELGTLVRHENALVTFHILDE